MSTNLQCMILLGYYSVLSGHFYNANLNLYSAT